MNSELLSLDTAAKLARYDKTIDYLKAKIKQENPKELSNSEFYKNNSDIKAFRYYAYKEILNVLEGDDDKKAKNYK